MNVLVRVVFSSSTVTLETLVVVPLLGVKRVRTSSCLGATYTNLIESPTYKIRLVVL